MRCELHFRKTPGEMWKMAWWAEKGTAAVLGGGRREEGGPTWLWADGRERHVGGRMEPRESGLSPSIGAGLPSAPVGVLGAGGWGHWDKEGECQTCPPALLSVSC